MLDEYKQACKEAANAINGWETLSKNDLCRELVRNRSDKQLFNGYFSALMYRYWNLIPKFYLQSSNVASPEDCYDWLVTAITYAIEHTRWDDPDSTVYNDPNGPDKVINRCMKSVRLTYYQYINRKKRKDNFCQLSLDELKENLNNAFDVEDEDTSDIDNDLIDLKGYIVSIFRKKDYFLAYLIDCIINEQVFEPTIEGGVEFSSKRLAKYLRQIDEDYCHRFSATYDLNLDEVLKTLKYCNFKSSNIRSKIENSLLILKHDPFILSRKGDTTC